MKTVRYIKKMIRVSPERTINLFHCLNELGDHSLEKDINRYMNSADENKNLTPAQCSALAYLLLMSATDVEFDLKKYLRSDEGLRRMLPVVKVSRRVWYDHGGECRIKPGGKKYACELTLDPNTAHSEISLSEGNKKVTGLSLNPYHDWVLDRVFDWFFDSSPGIPERFHHHLQVLCRESLTGRCYWEAERSGGPTAGPGVYIAVAYKSIDRKGRRNVSRFGYNDKSWCLFYSGIGYSVYHNSKKTAIPASSSHSSRVGVYLDWPAGTLSFYSVSSNTLTHLHTFHSTFTEPLFAGFGVSLGSSVSLCQIT
ncbi:stonustoxin subunit beta-like isoform X1 [Alosa pseudoharengus]|uniref:stonustoxin subunit beta-like isoform X1 n=1 Tax=Alosa pseudoharengus TaxID=34774 RepID=UPI003F8C7DF0